MKHKNIQFILIALLMSASFTSYAQIITTFAGNGDGNFTGGYSGDGGPATAAQLNNPTGVASDASGNIYIADISNQRIRIINTSGIINTFAGNGYGAGSTMGGYSGDGGPATAAEFDFPIHVAVDASGNIYIADDENDRVRIVNTSGIINTFAGNGYGEGTLGGGYSGDGGPATAAEIWNPAGITVDASGNVYIADKYNERIREVNTSGIINTIAGDGGEGGYSGDGGPATAAELFFPSGVAVDVSGNVYIADDENDRVRIVNTSGIISTFAGNGTASYSGDGGPATSAKLSYPSDVKVDASGNIYIADDGNNVIRIVNTSSIISTFAGNGAAGYSGDGGPATAAQLNNPTGVASDASGNIYIADESNDRIREVVYAFNVFTSATPSCNGESVGTVSATPYDGTGPYTYSWALGGETTSTVTGLSIGTYTITLTESSGATATASVNVTPPSPLMATAVQTTVSCYGESTGVAMASPSYGVSPYTYSWSGGGGTNSTATGLSGGTYTVTVQDRCGSAATASTYINQPAVPLSTIASETAISCYGESTGAAMAIPANSISPYIYSWAPIGGTNSTATGLSEGTYTVTVYDQCSASTASVIVTQYSPLRDSIVPGSIVNVSSCTGTTGTATVGITGGISPYTYSWNLAGGNNASLGGYAFSYTGAVQNWAVPVGVIPNLFII